MDYDNKRSGYAERVSEPGSYLIGQGSIMDANGDYIEMRLLKAVTKNGTKLIHVMTLGGTAYDAQWKPVEASRVWVKSGTLFENDTSDNDRAPKWRGHSNLGPGMERISVWTGTKNGADYWSLKFEAPFKKEEAESGANGQAAGSGRMPKWGKEEPHWGSIDDDEIPF